MKKVLLKISLFLIIAGLTGCVAGSGVEQKAVTATDLIDIKLECNSANRLGCRHKGKIYPWNAWVEAMGYNSTQYAVKEVNQSGNKAVVLVVER